MDNIVALFAPGYIKKNDSTYAVITDHLGSVKLVVNAATGVIVQRIEYDEYGNVTFVLNENEFFDFAFAGGMYDKDTKLIRFGARDYDASVGRWTTKDPIGFGGGVSNLYEYIVNDPVNEIDLYGKQIYFYARPNFFFRYPGVNRLAPSQRFVPRIRPRITPERFVEPKPQYMPPIELPKTWWGRLIDKISDLLGEMGFGEGATITPKQDKESPDPCKKKKKSTENPRPILIVGDPVWI